MDCGLVVFRVGIIDIRGKKGEIRGNVRTSASLKPIYAADNSLIDLYLTWNINIEGVNGRNVINGEPGTIWIHVGNLVCTMNQITYDL